MTSEFLTELSSLLAKIYFPNKPTDNIQWQPNWHWQTRRKHISTDLERRWKTLKENRKKNENRLRPQQTHCWLYLYWINAKKKFRLRETKTRSGFSQEYQQLIMSGCFLQYNYENFFSYVCNWPSALSHGLFCNFHLSHFTDVIRLISLLLLNSFTKSTTITQYFPIQKNLCWRFDFLIGNRN